MVLDARPSSRLLSIALNRPITFAEMIVDVGRVLDYLPVSSCVALMTSSRRLRDLLSYLLDVEVSFTLVKPSFQTSQLQFKELRACTGRNWRISNLPIRSDEAPVSIDTIKGCLQQYITCVNWSYTANIKLRMCSCKYNETPASIAILDRSLIESACLVSIGPEDWTRYARSSFSPIYTNVTSAVIEASQLSILPSGAFYRRIVNLEIQTRLSSVSDLSKVKQTFPNLSHLSLTFASGDSRLAEVTEIGTFPQSFNLNLSRAEGVSCLRQLSLSRSFKMALRQLVRLHVSQLTGNFAGFDALASAIRELPVLKRLSLISADALPLLRLPGAAFEDLCLSLEISKTADIWKLLMGMHRYETRLKRLHLHVTMRDSMSKLPSVVEYSLICGWYLLASDLGFVVSLSCQDDLVNEHTIMQLPWLLPHHFVVAQPEAQPMTCGPADLFTAVNRHVGSMVNDPLFGPPSIIDPDSVSMKMADAHKVLADFFN